ncbi:MAG: SDR family NAD(P)-dependent oxidoreductase [Magnetospirillum sp. WYHS-4]
MPGRLEGRIAVVTGASRGLGRAVALEFAREGADLVLVARTQGALEELDDEVRALGRHATLVPLDLRDGDGLDRLGAALHERHGKLDILAGCAGVLGVLGPLGHCKPEVFDEVMAVNTTANWRLIRSLDPLLRLSDAGRAIFATAAAAQAGEAYWGPYAASKAALEALARAWAAETLRTSLRVNLIDPGPLRTRLRAKAFPGEKSEGLRAPEEVAPRFVDLADPVCTRHGEIVRCQ